MFTLAVVCIGASGMEAQVWALMAARTLAGHTTQTSSWHSNGSLLGVAVFGFLRNA